MGPILKTLVFSTTPEVTRAWVDSICADWAFTSIIPAVRPAAASFSCSVASMGHVMH